MKQVAIKLAEQFPTAASARCVVITSFSETLPNFLMQYAPHLRRGVVVKTNDAIARLDSGDFQLLALHWSLCDKKLMKAANKRGVPVSVWTVNTPELIRHFYKLGVASVITDYPSMALPLLSEIKRKGHGFT